MPGFRPMRRRIRFGGIVSWRRDWRLGGVGAGRARFGERGCSLVGFGREVEGG